MFDFIKSIIGLDTCRTCLHRRLGGLYCGCRNWTVAKPSAWHRIGCPHYIDSEMTRENRCKSENTV